MADSVAVKVEGIDDLKRTLAELPRSLRRKVLVGALRKAGAVIRDEARRRAPILKEPARHRRPGVLRKAIVVRVSKQARRDGNVGVFVNVRPLAAKKIAAFKKTAAAAGDRWSGAQNPNDPYYWRWVEFGHRIVPRQGSQAGGGVTVYSQRLRNGEVRQRQKAWSAASITGRRRLSTVRVMAQPFLQPAAERLPQALSVFEREVLPQIEQWNKRK